MPERQVKLSISELTTRQVLGLLYEMTSDVQSRLAKVEKRVSALTEAVGALQAAVDNVAVRQNAHINELQSKISDAQARIDALTAEGVADDAALAAAKQEISDLLADAASAADTIKSQVDELNGLGADPSTPVEDVPVENVPDPVPAPEVPVDDSGDAPVTPEAPVEDGGDVTPPGDDVPAAPVDDAPVDPEPAPEAPAGDTSDTGVVPVEGGEPGTGDAAAEEGDSNVVTPETTPNATPN